MRNESPATGRPTTGVAVADAPGADCRPGGFAGDGNSRCMDEAFSGIYGELKAIAHRILARGRHGTLATTGLVHEAYVKLSAHSLREPHDRKHLYALCAKAMRQIVIDHARRLRADKRGAGQRVSSLDEHDGSDGAGPDSFLAVDRALDELERHDPRLVELIHLRVFAGLDLVEIAPLFGVTVRQLQRDWLRAQIWLSQALLPDAP